MLSAAEYRRYARHLTIPEFGREGQERLKAARILCVGAGGLGSPVLMHLAAAGIGRLGIVDADTVDESNLQRQLLFGTSDVGRKKVEAAAARLRDLNPHINIVAHEARFTRDNAKELIDDYDVLIDGTDNFQTRYLCNDAAVMAGKPNVHGAVQRFEGQVSVFAPHLGGPCYRCLFPQPPPHGTVPSCAEAGVLGVLPGFIGLLQATEALKLVTGLGQPLIGRLLHVDALTMRFREIKLRRDPDCALCGDSPTLTALPDYEAFCGPVCQAGVTSHDISVREFDELRRSGEPHLVLDVREPDELFICRFPESRNIPLGQLPERLGELDRSSRIVVHCKTGGRSARAVDLLRQRGFSRAENLAGGITAWSKEIDPTVPVY
jgi:molybdopterin/thiamine biosynthesis adenylyltransferase/rhodanese-related sulfurtransferase